MKFTRNFAVLHLNDVVAYFSEIEDAIEYAKELKQNINNTGKTYKIFCLITTVG